MTVGKAKIFLLTECEISTHTDLGAMLDGLRREKASGTLRVEFEGGGIRHISLSKKTEAPKTPKSSE